MQATGTSWLTLSLALALPLVPMGLSVELLRRTFGLERKAYVSLAAGAFSFALSGLWLARSAQVLWAASQGRPPEASWVHLTQSSGPFWAIALSVLVGALLVVTLVRGRGEKRKPTAAGDTVART